LFNILVRSVTMTRIPTLLRAARGIARNFVTVTALALMTVSTGRAAAPPVSPHPERRTAELTAGQVYDALNADPMYYFRHVGVHVQEGVVTLSGYVWEPRDIYRAQEVAARVPGVTRVVDQMEIEIW
jgi:osmotically-inducible protein OsmY